MKIIGITGKKRHGKDTFCALLKEHTLLNIQRRAFADPLKEEVAQILGVTLEFLEEFKMTHYRGLLQWWGTEYRREMFSQTYWVDRMVSYIEDLRRRQDLYEKEIVLVITDCRFPNEAECLRREGAKIVKVIRPSLNSVDNHASETQIDAITADFTLVNEGSLEDFKDKTLEVIQAAL